MPSAKGKERATEPEEYNGEHGTTSKEFEAFFAEFAPVRHAFVVTHKDQKTGEIRGKGVGIVAFAVKEDAEDVMRRFGSGEETLKISGRTLHIDWAKKKHSRIEGDVASPSKAPRLKSEPELEPPPPKNTPSKPSQPTKPAAPTTSPSPKKLPTQSTDPVAKRTIVLSNLPSSTTDHALWKKIRKFPGAKSISFPVEGEPGVAHAVFHDEGETASAVARLDGSTFKGAVIGASALAEGSAGKQKTKSNSLIIRNLPRKITENDLRTVFSKYGEIKSISLPTASEGTRAPPRFAFIWMTRRSDAEAAVKALNGARMKPGGTIEIVKAKAGSSGPVKEEDVEMKDSLKESTKDGSRVVAVDFAMSKSRWEEAKKNAVVEGDEDEVKEEENEDEVKSEEDEDDDEMDVDEEEENATGSEEEADGTAVEGSSDASSESEMDGDDPRLDFDGEDSDDWTDGDGEDEDSKPKSKQQKTEPPEGTTLFVRNVPFEATDDDLYQVFKTFGPLRYARIAFDHATGRSRGTGFVCFWKREVAQQVLKEAERVKVLAGAASGKNPTKHANQSHSILTPDPSSSVTAKLVLMGRTLDVVPALSKGDADNLKEAAEKLKEKRTDHRNLYLLREGVIFEDSPAAKDMPPAALKARLASYDQRRSTLRSNPALYISRTRLSVRNLPRFATERCLKHLGIHAVKAFNEEVKAGEREGVSKDEVEVDREMAKGGKKNSKHKKSGAVKQAKVSRHRTQVDPMHPQGLGRSDGFGFLELDKHTDALRVLRWANNRPG
ncbi:RNA recognition motif-containing protein, partial [Tulasnella sp. 408]